MTKFDMPAATMRLRAAQTKLREIALASPSPSIEVPFPPDPALLAEVVVSDLALALAEIERLNRRNAELVDTVRDLSFNPKSDDTRASGRTTRLMLRGLIALSEGHSVCVIAATSSHAAVIGRELLTRAAALQIPLSEHWSPDGPPYVIAKGRTEPRTGFRGVTLIDHFAIEQMEEAP